MDTVGQNIKSPSPNAAVRSTKPTTNIKQLLHNWGPVVLLTLGSLWMIQGALARTAWHGVVVRGADYDAGAVKAGAVIVHNITLFNLTEQPVDIYPVSGCGCTVVSAPDRPLPPLHECVVRTQIDTEGTPTGFQQKTILLTLRSRQQTWQRTLKLSFRLK